MSALVRIVEDRAVADSRDVAGQFGKQHKHVLRAIDDMVKDAPELAPNFGLMFYPVQTANGASRNARRFDMDRKGFMLLVMGFTGAKALEIKSRWIDAFDAMEQRLNELTSFANDDIVEMPLPTASVMYDYTPALAVIREARQVFGRNAAQRLWGKLGLPSVNDHPAAQFEIAGSYRVPETIRDWLAQCTRPDPQAQAGATDLFERYLAWCDDMAVKPESQSQFGRTLQGMGFIKRVDNRTRKVHRHGLGLIY